MKIKITIKKDSPAAKVIADLRAKKEAFKRELQAKNQVRS
jgi:hypothetical protein